MPRDINGNFTLDPSNPVAAGTVIETGWANPTLVDIAAALTDSLSRSGNGGMLTPFRFADGTVAAPGIAFTNEPSSGFYRAGLNDIRVSIGATDVMKFSPTGVTIPTGINNTPIGAVTPSTGAFTYIKLTGVLPSQGATPNTGWIDASNGQRFFALGPTAAAQGEWSWLSFKGDGTGGLTPMTLSGAGALTVLGSVVTPMVGQAADAALSIQVNAAIRWQFRESALGFRFIPVTDNLYQIGQPDRRISTVYTPIIDTGTAGPLALKVNGATMFQVNANQSITAAGSNQSIAARFANALNDFAVGTEGAPGNNYLTPAQPYGGFIGCLGVKSLFMLASNAIQAEFVATGPNDRWIKMLGGNGVDPIMGVSAGNLRFTSPILPSAGIVPAFESAEQATFASNNVNFPHGLGRIPKIVHVIIRCKIAESGYAVGDELQLGWMDFDTVNYFGAQVTADAANITLTVGVGVRFANKLTGALAAGFTAANWRFVVRAW